MIPACRGNHLIHRVARNAMAILWLVTGTVAAGDPSADTGMPINADLGGIHTPTGAWYDLVTSAIERQEYDITVGSDGLYAPNRRQNQRTRFGSDGIDIRPRTIDRGERGSFTWRTIGWGREGELQLSRDPGVTFEGTQVTYQYVDGLVEWYVNRPEGLEQGFRVPQRPPGSGRLLIAGEVPTELRAVLEDPEEVLFLDEDGNTLIRYGDLHVVDARGRDVPSHLAIVDDLVQIVVDDRDATYPLDVDPLMTSPAWTVQGDRADASLGCSVSVAGDVNGDGYSDVIVGADDYESSHPDGGRAFVFHGSATGLATTAAWTATGGQVGATFGGWVGPAGDVNGDGYDDVVVCAAQYQNGETREGKIFVYHGSPSGLSSTAAWTVEGNEDFAYLGAAAMAGDVNGDGYGDLAVGFANYTQGQTREGIAYVYHGSSGGLSTSPSWAVESNVANARFGGAVSTAGDTNGDGFDDLLVGASTHGADTEGRAYLFLGSGGGLSTTPAWTADGESPSAGFGSRLAPAGDVNGDGRADVVIGSPRYDSSAAHLDEGCAYVYEGTSTGLTSVPRWRMEGNQTDARLGGSVMTAGDINGDGFGDIVVGAVRYDGVHPDCGRAYLFLGSTSGVMGGAEWTVDGGGEQDQFSCSVASAGDVNGDGFGDVVVGARNYTNAASHQGKAYVYHGSADGLSPTAIWTGQGSEPGAHFGESVSSGGDVNGDGYDDVVVGAGGYDGAGVDRGRVQVFHGSASGPSTVADWSRDGSSDNAYFGFAVSHAGDVNGDGYGDVVIAGNDVVYVFHGSASGLSSSAAWWRGVDLGDYLFGRVVSAAGDVNGDGYGDVIVGSPTLYTPEAFIYYGSSMGLTTQPGFRVEGGNGTHFGRAVGSAGDVNGDGYSDVIVGAWQAGGEAGRAYVYHGSVTGPSTTAAWQAAGESADHWFGIAVATAGDVNGDGYDDVVVGAHGYVGSDGVEGRAYVYHGAPGGLAPTPAWTGESNAHASFYGYSVRSAGDVNGDGFSDVVVGAPNHGYWGRASVYHGSESGLGSLAWSIAGAAYQDSLGVSVSGAGDVNGDGYDDVIVGSHASDAGGSSSGLAQVHLGNDRHGSNPGVSILSRQLRVAGGTQPIALGGRSDSETAFRVIAEGRSAAGRVPGRHEFQVAELSQALPTAAVQAGSWERRSEWDIDISATGLAVATPHHWRLRFVTRWPYHPHTPWFTQARSVPSHKQLRTAGIGPGPDLVVTAIDPDGAPAGEDVEVVVTIANQGLVDAGVSQSSVTIDGDGCGGINTPDIPAGESRTISCVFSGLASGAHDVEVHLDYQNRVVECEEGNNRTTETLEIGLAYAFVQPDGAGDFATIQEAVDAVQAGGLVELADGIFTGAGNRDIDFQGKTLVLRSQSGDPGACIIDCEGSEGNGHRGFVIGSGSGSETLVQGITVRNGYVGSQASGAGMQVSSNITIRNCVFEHGEAFDGGGLHIAQSTPLVVDCVFRSNHARNAGGAIVCGGGGSPQLTGCRFEENTAYWGGGGVYAYNASPSLSGCLLVRNGSDHWGGGLHATQAGSAVTVDSCTFSENWAPQGAGLYNRVDATISLVNTIIAFSTEGEAAYCASGATVSVQCSDIHANAGGDWTSCLVGQEGVNGNFSLDPLFCDAGAGNYRVRDDSPCLPANNSCGVQVGAFGEGCTAIAVAEPGSVPTRLALTGIAPNPFYPSTTIQYGVPEEGPINVTVHDVSGRRVRTLVAGVRAAGRHAVQWDGVDERGRYLSPGVYFVKLRQGAERETRKIVLTR